MYRCRRFLFIVGNLIFLAVISGCVIIESIGNKALPDYNSNITLRGIDQEVRVYRDSMGIPHVYAQTETDLSMAVGYLMAQDRLWQMDLLRRVTQGRLAEIFGKQMVQTDLLMRSLQIPEKSRKILKKSDPQLVRVLKAFSRGINQYIETHSDRLPPEFGILGYKPEKWRPLHSINLIGYMAWDLTPSWETEMVLNKIAREVDREKYQLLIPALEKQETVVYPDYLSSAPDCSSFFRLREASEKLKDIGANIFTGSNNWAVSGKKSETGKPLLANDMHLSLSVPGIWYQMHQVVEGKKNVTGVALPGQPLIISGHNDTIAWGLTNVAVDDIDFYRETIHPEDSARYRLNGKWRDLEVEKEKIAIKGGDTAEKVLRYTHRGPIISGFKEDSVPVSMHWVGNEYSNEMRSVYLLNQASDWSEFKNALKTFSSVSQNVVYADIHGNIGMYCAAGVPIREGRGIGIYPGDTTRYDWSGLVPFKELPHSYNPERGFVSSANNKTVGSNYPYHISHWFALSPRIDRINQMLRRKKKLSVNEFVKIQTDFKSLLVPRLKPEIMECVGEIEEKSQLIRKAANILKNWDGVYTKNSPAAAIFEQFYINFAENLAKDEMGKKLYGEYTSSDILIRNLVKNVWNHPESRWCDDARTENKKEGFSDIVQNSFIETVDTLSEQMGEEPERWQWGKIHQLTLSHPIGGEVPVIDMIFNMNRGPFPVGGGPHTVCAYDYSFSSSFSVNTGPSQRHVYSLANWDSSRSVIPTGTSGIPSSRYYCDQTRTYVKNQYHRDLFSKRAVKQNTRYQMTIDGREADSFGLE